MFLEPSTVTTPPVKLRKAIFLVTCQKKRQFSVLVSAICGSIFDSLSLIIDVISVSSMLSS